MGKYDITINVIWFVHQYSKWRQKMVQKYCTPIKLPGIKQTKNILHFLLRIWFPITFRNEKLTIIMNNWEEIEQFMVCANSSLARDWPEFIFSNPRLRTRADRFFLFLQKTDRNFEIAKTSLSIFGNHCIFFKCTSNENLDFSNTLPIPLRSRYFFLNNVPVVCYYH